MSEQAKKTLNITIVYVVFRKDFSEKVELLNSCYFIHISISFFSILKHISNILLLK